jgi:hypothetical protein
MTGLGFSPAALQQAGELAQATGADVTFVESEFYRAPDVLPTGAFDLVNAGMGRCAGCRTSAGGPRLSPPCSGPGAGCSCARATRCCGRWTRSATTPSLSASPCGCPKLSQAVDLLHRRRRKPGMIHRWRCG